MLPEDPICDYAMWIIDESREGPLATRMPPEHIIDRHPRAHKLIPEMIQLQAAIANLHATSAVDYYVSHIRTELDPLHSNTFTRGRPDFQLDKSRLNSWRRDSCTARKPNVLCGI
jgi:hypothetical protein